MIHILKSKKNKQFYFNVTANNRKVIAQSEGYKTKVGCLKGIKSLFTSMQQLGLHNLDSVWSIFKNNSIKDHTIKTLR